VDRFVRGYEHVRGLVAEPLVGEGFDRVQRREVVGRCDALEQVYGWKAAGDDADGALPAYAAKRYDRLGGARLRQDQPPS
jgi:hypothetical protein